jgi:hypothetical protein
MRKKHVIKIIAISLFVSFFSQKGFSCEASDSIILSALHDELYRNFENLHAEGFNKPFFIAYTLADAKITYSSATLGALSNSGERSYKDWNVRLMVGDYDINDENFSGSHDDETAFLGSIDMPVDADYYGIRRSLWLTTNRVYNSAARIYKSKIALIEHKQLKDTDLEISDFSRSPVIQYKEPASEINYSKAKLDSMTRELSAIFKDYPDIFNSSVNSSVFESTVFFINSEGTEVQYPLNLTTLSISATTMTDDSEKIRRQIGYTVHNPEDLPDIEIIKKDIISLLDNLLALTTTERFDDDYSGPVLLIGDVVAQSISMALFNGSNNLVADRESLQSSRQMNMYYEKSENSFEGKIGKMVISKKLSITAEPQLKTYMGKSLLGSYQVDAEGVKPPEKLVLVDTGRLITLLNGRTPTRNVPESNGHMRFNYGFGGLTKQVGPGVIRITSNETQRIAELKKLLLEKAKEEGLGYAIIIRSTNVTSSSKPYEVYKVSIENGEEKLLRSVRLHSPNIKSLKRVLGVSNSEIVYNTFLSSHGGNGQGGIPASFISPSALLLEDFEMESFRKPLTNDLPIVENPIGVVEDNKNTIQERTID